MCETFDTYKGEEKSVRSLGEETCRKRQLGGPGHRWEDSVKADLKENRVRRLGTSGGLLLTR